ncbi:MAG TPA: formimidoylglutamase [Gemmatimonadaceae bacterium]|nr:formimidoylglutamase [Gemmatimonadaceae bacterium]
MPLPDTPTTSADDPRVGHLFGAALREDAAPLAVLIGFPSDAGVRRNGGRPGAASGPAAIRRALARLTPDAEAPDRFAHLLAHTRDLGDVAVEGDVEADQAALASAVAPSLAAGAFAIVLGGGHETAFGHFLAQARLGQPVRILNWDAHADVRELRDGRAHSGSPFRQALEHESGLCTRYEVAGLQPHSVAGAHLAYVRAHGAAHFRQALDDPAVPDALYAGHPTMVSFDLDAVDRAHAPGVSAPATDGLPVPLWLRAAYLAGRTPSVRGADVVELSPPLDGDGRTATLAALTVWQLLRGLAARAV